MKEWSNRIRLWLIKISGKKKGLIALFVIAFADASVFPFPVTTYFLVMVILNKQKLHCYVLIALLGTLAGALAGYFIGDFAWIKDNGDLTGLSTFIFNNVQGFTESQYNNIQTLFTKWNIWILCAATITPIPYGLFSVLSGALDINIFVFMITTFVCQLIKFFILGKVTTGINNQISKLTSFKFKTLTA